MMKASTKDKPSCFLSHCKMKHLFNVMVVEKLCVELFLSFGDNFSKFETFRTVLLQFWTPLPKVDLF